MQRFLLTIVLAMLSFISQAQKKQVVNFYLTPSVSEELLAKKGTIIKDFLEKETGITIVMKVPESYDDLVDHFGDQSVCFAMMSSQSYVLAKNKHDVNVKLRTVRFGHSTYQGMIITHVSSGIKSLNDLKGKTIAYTDELSTSGYLYPKKMLEKSRVKVGEEVFLKIHDEVVKQVYEKKVDAGAVFFSPPTSNGVIRDARARLKDRYPDVEQKVVILAKSDPIPNDPIVFSRNFDNTIANKICLALINLARDEKGKQALLELYGTEGFVKASDADYNSLRQVMGISKVAY